MSWALIPIIALIAWALVEMSKNRRVSGGDLQQVTSDLMARLEEAEAARARLRQRVENLEAIVTSEHFDLEREARRAIPAPGHGLPEGGEPPPFAVEEHDAAEDDEARAARLARRVRGG